MKLLTICLITLTGLSTVSFNPCSEQTRIYPEINTFFKSLKEVSISNQHMTALKKLSAYIKNSVKEDIDAYVVYSCTDNSFRSIAAQILTQTLISRFKFKKVHVYSYGNEAGTLSSHLLSFLQRIGYDIKVNKNGMIEIRFNWNSGPIQIPFLSIKSDDPLLPKKDFFSMALCDSLESNCPHLAGANFKYSLDFQNPKEAFKHRMLEVEFTQIAAEIYYALKLANVELH